MEVFTTFLTELVYHSLEIIKVIGQLAAKLSEIHFPVA